MSPISPALAALARTHLSKALSSLPPGPKILYVDDTLFERATSSSFLLSLFTTPQFLSTHSITKTHPLAAFSTHPPPLTAVFLLRPSALSARHLAAALSLHTPKNALVLLTPRRSRLVERVLRSSAAGGGGGGGALRIAVLPLGFLPFDDGIITLAWPASFREVVLEGNNRSILAAAAALNSLADVAGIHFATIRTAGAAAQATVDEYLILAGRKSHGVRPTTPAPADARPRLSSSPSPSPASRSPDAARRSGSADDASAASDVSTGSETAASAASAASAGGGEALPASLFSGRVSVANVLAGEHLKGAGGGERASATTSSSSDVVSGLRRYRRRPVTLVVLDRNVDVVTPLLTQWTYEGLLDEAVGLLRGNVLDIGVGDFKSQDASGMLGADARAPAAAVAQAKSSRRVQKRLRCEGDAIFAQLKDLNYWAAARLLGSVASSVQAYYDARPGRDTAEIGQVKDYVRGLKEVKSEHRSAAVHTAIAAEVSARTFELAVFKRRFELEREMLEGNSSGGRRAAVHESIARSEPLEHVLRLLCLWSLTGGGVDAEAFDFLRREVVATYGLSVLSLLGHLERAGLLTRSARVTSAHEMPWIPFVKFGFGAGSNGDGDGGGEADSAHGGGSNKSEIGASSGQQRRTNSSPLPPASSSVVGYSWQFVRAAMQLMTDFEPEAADSGGVSGPFSGYVPLTVRLIEAGGSSAGWDKLPRIAAHTLLLPPGHSVGEWSVRAGNMARGEEDLFSGTENAPFDPAGLANIDTVVLFVGGVTRAEASAVKVGAAKRGESVLIATTDVVGANQFVSMT